MTRRGDGARAPVGPPAPGRFVGVVVVDREGRLLLQERDEHAVIDPERWGLPGGHLEADEEPATGAARELAEETGVRIGPGALTLWRAVEVFHEAYGSHDVMYVYAARAALADADIRCAEGRQIVFVEPTAARRLDLTASAAIVVPEFLDSELYATMTR